MLLVRSGSLHARGVNLDFQPQPQGLDGIVPAGVSYPVCANTDGQLVSVNLTRSPEMH
jgi:hypothetical protein